MFNTSLRDQLKIVMDSGELKVTHHDGHKAWKAKFEYWHNVTHDTTKALDAIYGPNGGVNNYKGSIYCNSNLKAADIVKAAPKKYDPFQYNKFKKTK
jgi:hypothetical protein